MTPDNLRTWYCFITEGTITKQHEQIQLARLDIILKELEKTLLKDDTATASEFLMSLDTEAYMTLLIMATLPFMDKYSTYVWSRYVAISEILGKIYMERTKDYVAMSDTLIKSKLTERILQS
jgi:hypothetical protein